MANNKFSKNKLEYEMLQMTEKQKTLLSPVCDKVVAQLRLSGNPTLILLISLLGIYGIKFMALKSLTNAAKT